MTAAISRNIPLLYLIKISKWFMLYIPAVKLFYVENGLNDTDLFVLHAFYSFVIFLSEVPSGYLADVIGRKKTMVGGLFLGTAGFAAYASTSSYMGFLLAEIALGLGQSFISGADSALLYDSLLQENRAHKYLRDESRITASGNAAEALAGIVFTLLAFQSMRHYYAIQTFITIIGLITAFFLIEPTQHAKTAKIGFDGIWHAVTNTLLHQKQLSRYILFSSLIGFASLSMAWFAQIFLYEAGVKQANFGIYWTALNAMVFLGSLSAHRIDRLLSNRGALIYILFFLSTGFIATSQFITSYGIGLLLIFKFVRGSAHPILKERINALTTSEVRATVLSLRSLVIRILFAALAPLLGWCTERISLESALILCGTIILFPGIILLFLIFRTMTTSSLSN